jgi:hypothetical protein
MRRNVMNRIKEWHNRNAHQIVVAAPAAAFVMFAIAMAIVK